MDRSSSTLPRKGEHFWFNAFGIPAQITLPLPMQAHLLPTNQAAQDVPPLFLVTSSNRLVMKLVVIPSLTGLHRRLLACRH
jgi:hypothetical protein